MVSKIKAEIIIVNVFVVWIAHGRGRSKAISRSKSRNVIATRKNFIENGRRAELVGSNPHSYGFAFSAYKFIWGSQNAIIIRIKDRIVLIEIIINWLLFSEGFQNLLIGSQLYYLY